MKEYDIVYPNAQDNDSKGKFHLDDGSYRLWDRRIREPLAE